MKEVKLKNAAVTRAHYSPAVKICETMYISGQLPINPFTREFVEPHAYKQTLQCLSNLLAIVQQEGLSLPDIVKTTAYISDIALWDEVNQAYAEFFGDLKPSRTIVSVNKLHFDVLVEIEGIAIKETIKV